MRKYADALNLDFSSYEDFMSKYWFDVDPETWSRIWSYLTEFDDTGLMVRQGVIDIGDFYQMVGMALIPLWEKYKPLIEGRRKDSDPKTMDWFEYLIEELKKEHKRQSNR